MKDAASVAMDIEQLLSPVFRAEGFLRRDPS